MNKLLSNYFLCITAIIVPALAGFMISLIRKAADNFETKADDIIKQSFILEIADAVSDAVAATSQTYVDALKNKGEFTKEAQREAAQRALEVCTASLTPAAKVFIKKAYGDLDTYLANKIEAEVRSQKLDAARLTAF